MKAYYDSKPAAIERVGNGSILYRYNIEEEAVSETTAEDTQETTTKWRCDEVQVWEPLTANKITQKVLTERWDADTEQKLINEYNAAQLGMVDDDEASEKIEAYKAFLQERAEVKAQVDTDCEEYGIK